MDKIELIQLFLSVPPGLEDVAVRTFPGYFTEAASTISYRKSTGYVTVEFNAVPQIRQVITDLVQHPPLCIFAAYISIGVISVAKEIFTSSKDLLAFVSSGFQQSEPINLYHTRVPIDLGLKWQEGASILKSVSEPLAVLLNTSPSDTDHGRDVEMPSVRFRASFDRGDVQHKGVRSQDLAAGLGGVTGKVFPSWKVDLEKYDIEVMARWIQEDLENVYFKWNRQDQDIINEYTGDTIPSRAEQPRDMKMQVGMTLPLEISSCPYRYRPMDGRTSLKIEIAYTLLAMSDPQPGNFIMDTCSGVGTIPIVGAANYPECFFAGVEYVPFNVEKANENSMAMVEKVNLERSKLSKNDPLHPLITKGVQPLVRPPCIILGDARSVCWRDGIIDLIVSDLPWGQRESSHQYNCKLYPKLLKEVIRLLRVGGRAILVTGERKLLQRNIDAPFAKSRLQLINKREITIGFKVMVFELLRK